MKGQLPCPPVEATITVHLPSRAWAVSAEEEMRAEGLATSLARVADRNGLWALEISGCAERIALIRAALLPAPPKFDWEAGVNRWVS